jgi:hypothetical protein
MEKTLALRRKPKSFMLQPLLLLACYQALAPPSLLPVYDPNEYIIDCYHGDYQLYFSTGFKVPEEFLESFMTLYLRHAY